MPLHPTIEKSVKEAARLAIPDNLPIVELRKISAVLYDKGAPRIEVRKVSDRLVAGPGGGIPIRIYWPSNTSPRPVLVYLHGSGFCIHSIDTHDTLCRALCVGSDCIVVSVDYRLAPEHRYPAAVEDSKAAVEWVDGRAEELGGVRNATFISGEDRKSVV